MRAGCPVAIHIRIAQAGHPMTVKTSNAPELTAEQVQRILIQPLQEQSKFLASGPRIFDSAGPIRIPKLGGMVDPTTGDPATPDWIGESELITNKDVDFKEVTLLPSTMKSIKTLTRYSNEMARQSVIALDATIQQSLVFEVADELDKQLFSATGDGVTKPKGLLAYDDVQEIDLAGGTVDLDDLTDAWGLALSANVNMSGLKWVMRAGVHRAPQGQGGHRQQPPDPAARRDAGQPVPAVRVAGHGDQAPAARR